MSVTHELSALSDFVNSQHCFRMSDSATNLCRFSDTALTDNSHIQDRYRCYADSVIEGTVPVPNKLASETDLAFIYKNKHTA